jgi:hypothetical protein
MNLEEQPTSDQATHAGLVVERAGEADWERVKAVRLAALAESPRAFGSTLAEEREHDEADWRAWCRDTAAGDLYRRAGFSETGACRPLPSNPALIEDQLTLDLR